MNVRLAILFAAVAEERSFTRAAARLNIAQPWLSVQMRKFEEQLGFLVFDRVRGAIELTQEGEKMLPMAAELAATARRLRELTRRIATDAALLVRVGAHASSAGIPEFARLNDDFAAGYRDISLIIEGGNTIQLLADVANGRLDAALVLAPFDETGLRCLLLGETAPFVLVNRSSGLATAGRIAAADLAGSRVSVMPRSDHPAFYDALHGPLEAAGAELKTVPEAGRSAMEHFARIQQSCVLMVEGDASDYAGDRELVAVPLETDLKIRHLLVRPTGEVKRAVDRYWRAAGAVKQARN